MVGIDLGKHSFYLSGQANPRREMFRKKLSGQQVMLFFSNDYATNGVGYADCAAWGLPP